MKLHNKIEPDPHSTVWELLPWYVNGSLSQTETAMVEAHKKTCHRCQIEIARQRLLSQTVLKTDPFEVPLARSWETLRAQVEADAKARRPARRRWFDMTWGRGVSFLGAATAACVIVVMGWQGGPPTGDFTTLTSAPEKVLPTIKFTPAPGIAQAELEEILARFGGTLQGSPSDGGVYTAMIDDATDLQAIADELTARSEILFAAPGAD